MSDVQLSLTGEDLRDAGIAQTDENTSDRWKDAADRAIAQLAWDCKIGLRDQFSSEDVRALAGDPPDNPNAMGARFLHARRRGVIHLVGYGVATRPEAHACRLTFYRHHDTWGGPE